MCGLKRLRDGSATRLRWFMLSWILGWLATSTAWSQYSIDAWPPLEQYAERLATLPGETNGPPIAEMVPSGESTVLLNAPNHVEPIPTPAPTIPADVPTESFWYPDGWQTWLFDPAWDAGLELGINATEGNSQAFSFRLGGNVSRKTELWELKTNVIYAKSAANGLETQHNAIFNAGYERQFRDTPWSHFGKLSLEYDEFKAFDLRLAPNAGLAYQFVKTDDLMLKGRFGAGVSHEINGPDDRWVPEAVFGGDFTRQISKRQKFTLTADYFPEWTDFTNYRFVTDMAWNVALDEASKLSLKLSVNDRYDSTPNGRKPNDVIYALLLLWTP